MKSEEEIKYEFKEEFSEEYRKWLSGIEIVNDSEVLEFLWMGFARGYKIAEHQLEKPPESEETEGLGD